VEPPAGIEPTTYSLRECFAHLLDLPMLRSGLIGAVRQYPGLTALPGSFWHGYGMRRSL